jgi:hypothetical protein
MTLAAVFDNEFGKHVWRPTGDGQTAIITARKGVLATDQPLPMAGLFPGHIVVDLHSELTYLPDGSIYDYGEYLTSKQRQRFARFGTTQKYLIAAAGYRFDVIPHTSSLVASVHLGCPHASLDGLENTLRDAFYHVATAARRVAGLAPRKRGCGAIACRTERGAGYTMLERKMPLVIRTPRYPVGYRNDALNNCLTAGFQWQ